MTQTDDLTTAATTLRPQKQTGMYFLRSNFKMIAIVSTIFILGAGYFHQAQVASNLERQNQNLAHPHTSSQAQATLLRDEVGKLIELPRDETPTIATVVDPNKLKNQAFFISAQAGDKVLMFPRGKEAVLYRPGTHKIVQVAPLNPGGAAATTGNTTLNSP